MKPAVAAIEFGTSKIVALIGELDASLNGKLLGYGTALYNGYTEQGWNQPDEEIQKAVSAAVSAAQAMAHVPAEKFYVGVPALFTRVTTRVSQTEQVGIGQKITLETVDSAMDNAIEPVIEGFRLMHKSPCWFAIGDTPTMEPVGQKADKLSCCVSFCFASNAFIEKATALLKACGFEAHDFACVPLGEALLAVPPEERDKTAVLIDCGYLSTQIMAVRGDALAALSVIDDGAGYFTASLAQELGVDLALAEQIKRQIILAHDNGARIEIDIGAQKPVVYQNKTLLHIVEPYVDEMTDEIHRRIDAFGIEIPQKASYYLTGGGLALMHGARYMLGAKLGHVIKAVPVRQSTLPGANYTSALGLLELVFEQISEEEENKKGNILKNLKSIFKK